MRKNISVLMIILLCLTMMAPVVSASELSINNQLNKVLKSKPYEAISSQLEKLGYEPDMEMINSGIVDSSGTPVSKVTVPFSNKEQKVDLIYADDGMQEIAGVGIKMSADESKLLVEKVSNKDYVKQFIGKLNSEGYEINYKDTIGLQKIIARNNKINDISTVVAHLTKNDQVKGSICFESDGTIFAITYDDKRAYLLQKDGILKSKVRTITSNDVTSLSNDVTSLSYTCNLAFADCMMDCICSGSPGECVMVWGTCAASCCGCFATGVTCPACLICLAGAYTCLFVCW